jgi:predicted DNA binding protein
MMKDGVRARLAVRVSAGCPVASLSTADADASAPMVRDVTWTRATDGQVTEEFRIPTAVAEACPDALADAEPVLTVGDDRVYQFTRDAGEACACEVVERLDCPVAEVTADDGDLLLTLHLPDVGRLRDVVGELEGVAADVEVRYLVRADAADDGGRDPAVVDRGRLTDRQREVLETAYRLGYFEYRGGANASAVADELGINNSTFAEHLSNAQSKLLGDLLVR